MGFFQVIIAITVEMLVVIYLSTLSKLIDIIMKFVSMAAIVKFDDMYAASLFEHKIRGANGKKMKKSFFRHMIWKQPSEVAVMAHTLINESEVQIPVSSDVRPNPRKGKYCLKFMRFLQKTCRMYYVCFNYYFLPYIALFVTFLSRTSETNLDVHVVN